MYRVGANAGRLPINQPRAAVNNGNQDAALDNGRTRSMVNYRPSRLQPRASTVSARYSQLPLAGSTQQHGITREQNFKQAGELYRSYSKQEQRDLVNSFGQSWRGR